MFQGSIYIAIVIFISHNIMNKYRDMNPWPAVLLGYFIGDLWHCYINLN